MNPILAPLFARRSVRKYQSKPVPEALLRDVLEAAMAAPSANEKDPWEILVVQNPETLANIAAGLPYGKMLVGAPVGFVMCAASPARRTRPTRNEPAARWCILYGE